MNFNNVMNAIGTADQVMTGYNTAEANMEKIKQAQKEASLANQQSQANIDYVNSQRDAQKAKDVQLEMEKQAQEHERQIHTI